jgi:hypothetical protein
MIYYLTVTPNIEGNRLISPKEFLKAKGIPFTCHMAPDGKGKWLYEYEAKDESIIKELSEAWKDCTSVSQADAKTLIETWGTTWSRMENWPLSLSLRWLIVWQMQRCLWRR